MSSFLNDVQKIIAGVSNFLSYTSYIGSQQEISLRKLSSKMIQVFYEDIVKADLKTLFPLSDIIMYSQSFKALYLPRRKLINQELSSVLNQVTLLVDTLYGSSGQHKNVTNSDALAANILSQIAQATESIRLIQDEDDFINLYFKDSEHLKYKPTYLLDSKNLWKDCDDKQDNLIRTMKNITVTLDSYLQSYSIQDLYKNNTEGEVTKFRKTELISILLSASLILKDDTMGFEKCLHRYHDFLVSTEKLLTNLYDEINLPALPEFTLQIEMEQINLKNLQALLESLKDEIGHNNKTKLQIAAEMNATFILDVREQLEALRGVVITDILDQISEKIDNDCIDEAVTAYESALTSLVSLQNYLDSKTSEKMFKNRTNRLRLLREVK